MLSSVEKEKYKVDLSKFDKLLSRTSRLLDVPLHIKDSEGNILASSSRKPEGFNCTKHGTGSAKCISGSIDIIRKIEGSGKSAVVFCNNNIEVIGIPIMCSMNLIGILFACCNSKKGKVRNELTDFFEELADRISSEIAAHTELDHFAYDLSSKYEELNLIYDLGQKLGGISRPEEAVRFIAEQSRETLNADLVIVSIPDKNIRDMSYISPEPLPFNIHDRSLMDKMDVNIISSFVLPRIPPDHIVLNKITDNRQLAGLLNTNMGMIAVPVKLKENVAGCLYMINFDQNRSFHTGDVRLAISIAHQISMGLTNAELYKELKDFMISVIKTLVHSIEAKDAYTRGHSDRVSNLTMDLAENMGLRPEEKDALSWAAILHDIGKIGISEDILTKPGRLTEEEFSQIKHHPEVGYKILSPIDQLNGSLEGIRHHHERYDGNGYPSGLKGTEIPLFARIISVADTYDAMTSDRSYRKAKSHDDAIAIMLEVKGKQLDPDIVDMFVNRFNEAPSY